MHRADFSFTKLAWLLALPVLLSGCVFPGDSGSRGVNLSDAMKSSAAGDRRELAAGSSSASRSEATTETPASADSGGGGFLGAFYDEQEFSWQMLADVRYSIPSGSDFKRITHYTLTPVTYEDEHDQLGLYLGGASVKYQSGSLPELGTRDPWMFELGLSYRRYLNHSRTGLSPYLAASLGYQLLNWRYRNPIVVGGEVIESDGLHGVQGYVGFGVSTRRANAVSAFAEAGVGGTVFFERTWQGFKDDVFDSFGFVSFKAGLSVKF